MKKPERTTEPADRLGRLAAAMTDALEAHPEYRGDQAVVFLSSDFDKRAVSHLSGYENDLDAMVDVFVHMQAVFRANGRDIDFIGVPDDLSGLDPDV